MREPEATVFIVDDDVSVRRALQRLIGCAGLDSQTFGCARDFLSRPRPSGPSCLVLDINLPDLHGLELQRHVARARSDMPVIVISGCVDVPTIVQAMKAGAVEFLMKPFDAAVLLEAIRDAIARSAAALDDAAELRALRDRYASLTHRERDVMALVVAGRLNKQVGADLGISEITVKAHRGKMMRKMAARSLPDLVNMAAKLGASRDDHRALSMWTAASAAASSGVLPRARATR